MCIMMLEEAPHSSGHTNKWSALNPRCQSPTNTALVCPRKFSTSESVAPSLSTLLLSLALSNKPWVRALQSLVCLNRRS